MAVLGKGVAKINDVVGVTAAGRGAAAASLPIALSTEDLAVLTALKTALEILDNAIAGNEIQADILTLPALPSGTNNIGDVDVLTLPALPAGSNAIGTVTINAADVVSLTGVSTLLSHIPITPAAATIPIPIPPATTLVELHAQGGQVRVQNGGVADADQGRVIEDGTSIFIEDIGPIMTAYAATGVTLDIVASYRPNTTRPIVAFDRFARWRGFTWPVAASRTTMIGGKTWTVVDGSWSVSTSSAAVVQSVAPGDSVETNSMLIPVTAGCHGWIWAEIVLAAGSDAAIVVRDDGTGVNANIIRAFASDHATDANTIDVIRRQASSNTVLSTISSGISLPTSTPLLLAVLLENNDAAYVWLNGQFVGVQSLSTTLESNTYIGINTTGQSRFVAFGHCGL